VINDKKKIRWRENGEIGCLSFTQRRRDDEGTKGGEEGDSGIPKERNYGRIMRPDWISRESRYTAKNSLPIKLTQRWTWLSVLTTRKS
jgi:hypothetical protein